MINNTPSTDNVNGGSGELPRPTMPDTELIERVQEWVSQLCKSGGRAWSLQVPVNFDKDPDVLITELVRRFKERLNLSEVKQLLKKQRDLCSYALTVDIPLGPVHNLILHAPEPKIPDEQPVIHLSNGRNESEISEAEQLKMV